MSKNTFLKYHLAGCASDAEKDGVLVLKVKIKTLMRWHGLVGEVKMHLICGSNQLALLLIANISMGNIRR
jgi:hypothetical protein